MVQLIFLLVRLQSSGLKCIDCQGYCENACRRKKIDTPVSIRNMQIFVYSLIKQDFEPVDSDLTKQKVPKRFSSRIGTIEQSELKEWLKECKNDVARFREISDIESAARESESCMHCDCRAAVDCRLRLMADEFSVKDPKGNW